MVAIGGGHGLGKVLNTFSELGSNLTGIVATTDNGGSTGKLRNETDCIAWGDLRNCIAHLAGSKLGSDLLNYRFKHGDLENHCLGNLIFHALEQLEVKPIEIIEIVRRLLRIDSRLYPMSEQPTHLMAESGDKTIIGELAVDNLTQMPESLSLTEKVYAPNRVIRSIQNANVILLGPGSFLTSIMPALLVEDIYHAICLSQAKIIFIDNLGEEHGTCSKTDLNERLNWLKTIRPNLNIDAVLSSESASDIDLSNCLHIKSNLNDSDVSYRHNEVKLRQAIYSIISQGVALAS